MFAYPLDGSNRNRHGFKPGSAPGLRVSREPSHKYTATNTHIHTYMQIRRQGLASLLSRKPSVPWTLYFHKALLLADCFSGAGPSSEKTSSRFAVGLSSREVPPTENWQRLTWSVNSSVISVRCVWFFSKVSFKSSI